MYLFVQECKIKDEFISNLKSKAFEGFHHDLFITQIEPQKIIQQIDATIKYSVEDECPHIYGQQMWHGDAFIVGNRAALLSLRNALDQALQFGEKKEVFFPTDEEGYDLYVNCVEDEFYWGQLDSPYHDPETCKKRMPPLQAFKHYKIYE